jgi:hypothetical protein
VAHPRLPLVTDHAQIPGARNRIVSGSRTKLGGGSVGEKNAC